LHLERREKIPVQEKDRDHPKGTQGGLARTMVYLAPLIQFSEKSKVELDRRSWPFSKLIVEAKVFNVTL
jgi:hypothetical protein